MVLRRATRLKSKSGVDAIIGHTGFVGGALTRQHGFAATFNKSNLNTLADRNFDLLVCAAAPGSMLLANQQPDSDWKQIDTLLRALAGVRCRRFVLISSIAVLADRSGGHCEDTSEFEQDLPYGRHRRLLEAFVENNFESPLIVRLPALFGKGLRKNFIFDLINPVPSLLTGAMLDKWLSMLNQEMLNSLMPLYIADPTTGLLQLNRTALNRNSDRAALEGALLESGLSALSFHSPETTHQFYDIGRLWSDINVALRAGLSCIHLAPEGLRTGKIHRHMTGRVMQDTGVFPVYEDMQTCFAGLWGRQASYLDCATNVLAQLSSFYTSHRRTS